MIGWKGLDFCEGFAADYPYVVDYYLHGGAQHQGCPFRCGQVATEGHDAAGHGYCRYADLAQRTNMSETTFLSSFCPGMIISR